MGKCQKKKKMPKCSKRGRPPIKRLSKPIETTRIKNPMLYLFGYTRCRKLKALQCSHVFHEKCIDHWLHTNKNCPVCREPSQKPESAEASRGFDDRFPNSPISAEVRILSISSLFKIRSC
ncbi:hypothetical protein TNCT_336471 [Trichonephila clavata]|uniref:RING-type domain-containing protein n=1 Tax=Trichonephila clavata TaxID=2740835 RepID=A0A8X6FFW7_TRICU|nr:hypothetical protein TNCT_336471 [Trichonephila clavata]